MKKEYERVYLDSNYTFGYDNGFAVAAAFWRDLGENEEYDEEVGSIKFVIKHWKSPDDAPEFRELK